MSDTQEMPVQNGVVEEEAVDWEKKEQQYLDQIANLRKLNEKLINYSEEKSKKFEAELQKLQHEKDLVQRKLDKIELDELKEAASGSNKNIESFKERYDKGFYNTFFNIKKCQLKSSSFEECTRSSL